MLKWVIICFLIIAFPFYVYSKTHYLVYFKPKDLIPSRLAISEGAKKRRLKFEIPIDKNDYSIEPERLRKIEQLAPIQLSSRWLNAVLVKCDTLEIEKIKELDFVDRIEMLSVDGLKWKVSSHKLEMNYTKDQYGAAYSQIDMHGGQYLHNAGFEGQGIKIAVFDAGFEGVDRISSFSHLFSEDKIHPIKNIVENTNNLFTSDGHGTAVLGCMASFIQDTIVASAPKADYYLFITEDPRSETRLEEVNWVIAAEMADSIGVDIINSSLGYHQFDDPNQNYTRDDMNGNTTIVSKAAAIAVSKGILVVNSAGNHGNKDWNIITAPADVEGVISVGALDINGNLADFSSRGYFKSNFIKPNIVGVGKGTTLYYDLGTYHYGSGTSFSSPLLAGLIACFWQKNSTLKPQEVRTIIYSLSTNYVSPNRDIGFGVPRFDKSVNLNFTTSKDRRLSLYPNPSSNGNTILEITSADPLENAEINVYFGSKHISTTKINLIKGVNHVFINTDGYSKGLYFFRIKMGNFYLEERYLKN